MNWKTFVEVQNEKAYILPEGWDSKERIAEQLGCADDSVRRCLAPAIKAGTIESGVFPVWDSVTKRIMRVTAYRRAPKPVISPSTAAPKKPVK
jgi:hypothetical protein